ncbi:IRE1 [Symbiodinium sp. KB8]|nr:IRE1 [Symbiodinium sp. KB8]
MPDVQVPLPPGHLLPQPGNPWDPQWGPASPPRRPDTAHRRSLTPGSSSPTSGSTAPRLELGNLSTSLVHLPVTPTAPLPGAPLQPIKVDASPVMEQPVVLADHRGRPLAVYLWTTRRTPVLSPHGHAVLEQKADGSFVPQTVVIAGERYLGGRQGSRVDVVFSKDFEADFLTRTVSAVWDGEDAEPVPTPARSPRSEVGFAGHAELDLLVSHLTSRYGGVTTISAPPHIQALLEWGWPASTLGLQLAADTVRQRMSHHMRSLFPEVNLNLQPAAGWATWQVVLAALAAAASVGVLGLGLWVAQRGNGEGQREGAGGPPPLPPIHVADKPARLPSVPASPVQPASPEEVEVDGAVFRKLGQQGLLVGQAILGKGSHGTVVLDGRLRSRPVAVKRMLRSFYDLAQREVDLLIRSDGHPNIVRYFACAEESDFVFLALERCECTLAQALQGVAQRRAGLARRVRGLLQPTGRRRRGGTRGKGRSVGPMPGENSFDALWVDDGEDSDGGGQATGRPQPAHPGAVQDDPAAWLPVPLPSDGSRMFLHSLVSGMAHLHSSCRIVHRDLKPGNVLLARAHRPARVVEAEGAPGGTHSKSVKHGRVPLWTAECGAWGGRWVPKISDMGLGKQLHGGSSITDPARRRSQATGSGDSSGHLRMGRGAGDASTDTAGVAGTVGWQAPELLAQIFGQSPGTLASSGAPSLPLAVGEPETSVQWDRLRPMQVVAAWAASDADWLPAMPVHLLPEGSLGSAEAQQAASQIQTEGTDDAGVDGPGQKRAVDVWAMGCMLYAVVDAAGHPFGPVLSRQERVLRGQHDLSRIAHLPELGHLLRGMLATRPSQRPRSVEVLEHPFFWSDARRCAFLQEVSDRLDREGAQCPAVAALDALTPAVCGGRGGAAGWGRRLPAPLLADATARRSYDFSRLSELLRLFRNQRHHFRELSRASLDAIVRGAGLAQSASSSLQSQDVPTALLRFFTAPPRFPRLLMAAYAVATWYFAHEPEFVALLGPRTTAKWGVLAQLQYVPSAPASPAREGGMPATPAPATATPKRTPKRQTLTSKPAATPPTQRPLAAAATPKPASTPQPWLLPQAEWLAAAASSSQAARDERLWISRSGDVDGGGQPLRGASVVYEGGLAVRAGDGLHLTTRFKGGGNTGGARYKAAVCSDWANKAGLCREEHPKLFKVFNQLDVGAWLSTLGQRSLSTPIAPEVSRLHPSLQFSTPFTDNSGRISQAELVAHFSKHADELDSMTVSPEEVGDQAVHLLSVVDQDRSKTVSFEEFVKCVVHNPTKASISQEWTDRAGLAWYLGDDHEGQFKPWHLLLAGGLGGLVSRMVTAPAERVRLILQARGLAGGGPLEVFRRVVATEGVRALWRSNLASCLQAIANSLGRDLNMWERLACGGLAGASAGLVTHPLELIRTRLAVQSSMPAPGGLSMAGVPSTLRCVSSTSVGGVGTGALRGSGVAMSSAKGAHQPPASTTMPLARVVGSRPPTGQASTPSTLQRVQPAPASPTPTPSRTHPANPPARAMHVVSASNPWRVPSFASLLNKGTTGGLLASAVRRVTGEAAALPRAWGAGGLYSGVLDAAGRIYARDGVRGFYRGLGPSLVASTVFVSIMQSAFDSIVSRARSPQGLAGIHWQCQDLTLTVLAGLGAGCLAQLAVHPVDTVKRRMMTLRMRSARSQTAWNLARNVVTQEGGWRALYAGVTPALGKVVPAVIISLAVRELVLGRARHSVALDSVNTSAALRVELPSATQWLRPSWAVPRAHPVKAPPKGQS